MKTKRSFVLIAKWLGIFALLTVVATLSGESATDSHAIGAVILWGLFLGLVLYPGKDPKNPRLFKIIPLLWALDAVTSLGAAIALHMGSSLNELFANAEPWMFYPSVLIDPALVYLLVKRHAAFVPVLITGAITQSALEIWTYSVGIQVFASSVGDLLAFLAFNVALTVYLVRRFNPRR